MRVSSWLYLTEQTCCGVCLLLAIGLCAGLRRASPLRLTLTALAMSIITMLAAASVPWLRVTLYPLTAATPLIAWPHAPRRLQWRMGIAGMGLSMWMTGLMRLLSPLALPGALTLLLVCAALCAMPRTIRRTASFPAVTTVELRLGSRKATLTALIDSGNLLQDVITGLPVIVISRRAAAQLMSLPQDGRLLPGMRLMNVRTISGTAMMTILRPDSVRLLTGGHWLGAQALIGLSPDGYEGFQALLPACLIPPGSASSPHQALSQGG